MSDESLNDLLPSPERVRCGLCLDLALQVRWTVEELRLQNRVKEDELAASLRRDRDRALLLRLRELLPIEDLPGASRDPIADIGAIYRRHPFVYAMRVIRGATEFVELKEAFEESIKPEQTD